MLCAPDGMATNWYAIRYFMNADSRESGDYTKLHVYSTHLHPITSASDQTDEKSAKMCLIEPVGNAIDERIRIMTGSKSLSLCFDRTRPIVAIILSIVTVPFCLSDASAEDGQFEDAVIYDHNPSTNIGDAVFGNIIADFGQPDDALKRCSHGGPVCMEYANGDIVAFYANTSSHNIDGWSEYAISKDGGKTWDKYHPFAYSKDAYDKDKEKPIWIEEGLVTSNGVAVLVLTEFVNKSRSLNRITRSTDNGKTWSEPVAMREEVIGYPAAVAVKGDECFILFDCPGREHELWVSTDDGETWNKRSSLTLQDDAWYGGMCITDDGRILAGAYVSADENHFYCCISEDGGKTWSKQYKAPVDQKVRDPELAYLNGKYYLHGRAGHSGKGAHRFVVYQSDDGLNWKPGVIVSSDGRGPDGYSHNCIINRWDDSKPNEIMVLYSIVYEKPRTSEYVFFIKSEE